MIDNREPNRLYTAILPAVIDLAIGIAGGIAWIVLMHWI